ncbi:unnamed protein product [Cladocopium goreaui]|uniref:Copia protein n=1 Tax=Cladocopium goreaui TaxID=2562237 RepID=A0A9P1DP59_9DINO|nr:unnamed protein product [Cladocopium goreaui]
MSGESGAHAQAAELQGTNKSQLAKKSYEAYNADEIEEASPAFFQETDGEWDEESIYQLMADNGDEDAIYINEFEDQIVEAVQEHPDLSQCFVSYQEARARVRERARARGFWPVKGKAKGKGFTKKGKGGNTYNQGSNAGFMGRKRSLADRIANSTCRLCGMAGHWKRECPQRAENKKPEQSTLNEVHLGFLDEDDIAQEVIEVLPPDAVDWEEAETVFQFEEESHEAIIDTGASRAVVGSDRLSSLVASCGMEGKVKVEKMSSHMIDLSYLDRPLDSEVDQSLTMPKKEMFNKGIPVTTEMLSQIVTKAGSMIPIPKALPKAEPKGTSSVASEDWVKVMGKQVPKTDPIKRPVSEVTRSEAPRSSMMMEPNAEKVQQIQTQIALLQRELAKEIQEKLIHQELALKTEEIQVIQGSMKHEGQRINVSEYASPYTSIFGAFIAEKILEECRIGEPPVVLFENPHDVFAVDQKHESPDLAPEDSQSQKRRRYGIKGPPRGPDAESAGSPPRAGYGKSPTWGGVIKGLSSALPRVGNLVLKGDDPQCADFHALVPELQVKLVLLCRGTERADAPLLWYKTLRETMEGLGFVVSPFDGCVFTLVTKGHNGKPKVHGCVGLHVDDGIGGGDKYFREIIGKLRSKFEFGAYNEGDFEFCGVRYYQWDDGSIEMSQDSYVQKIHPIEIPRNRRQQSQSSLTPLETQQLRQICGSLQYAAVHTRPDLSAKVGELQSAVASGKVEHLINANRVLYEAKANPVSLMIVPIPEHAVTFCAFSDASFETGKGRSTRFFGRHYL